MPENWKPLKPADALLSWQKEQSRPILMDQRSLFNKRVSTLLPGPLNGQHLSFRCIADDGAIYFCKADFGHMPIRATEWLSTRLAEHLGIAVAAYAIVEDGSADTYFGSRSPGSVADEMEVSRLLTTPATGELGQPLPWLGKHLARLRTFDLFVDNPDRIVRNFILDRDGAFNRLCAIDFASARLLKLPVDQFPVASERTILVGNMLKRTHGPHTDAALEMVDRIGAVPTTVIEDSLKEVPEEWLGQDQRGMLYEYWSGAPLRVRLERLRALVSDER